MANTKVTGDLIASSTIATGNIADNAVTSDKISGITTAHIAEGTNLYYTDSRADARITAATTSDLSEGTNLYYTDARARSAVSVSGNALSYDSSTGVITSNFEESPTFTGGITATYGNYSSGVNAEYFRTAAANTNYNLITRDSTGNALFVQNSQSNANQPIANFRYGSSSVNQGTAVLQVSKDNSHFVNCNVGIGTASPAAKLSVVGSGENGGIFFNNSGAQEHRFYSSANSQFNTIGSSSPIWHWAQYTGVGVAPNYKMTLNSTGLGIGTTSPESGAKLDVRAGSGGKIVLGSYDANYKIVVEGGDQLNFYNGTSATTAYINYGATGTPGNVLVSRNLFVEANSSGGVNGTIRIKSDGKVGINTTTPAFKTHIRGGSGTEETVLKIDKSSAADSGGHTTIVGLGVESAGWAKAGIAFERTGAYDTGKMHFLMYPTGLNTSSVGLSNSVMTINNDGKVGIGTTSPGSALELYGNTSSGGYGGYPALTLRNDNASGFSVIHFNQSTAQKARVEVSNSAGSMGLYTGSGANGITILNNSNVGVGATSPTLGKLQVAGSGYFGSVGTGNATTKAEMQSNAVLRLKPHDNNSTNMNFAQVNGGNGIGIQTTNGAGTANWDIALSPFGGNVGIGTASPTARLDVSQASGSTLIRLSNSDATLVDAGDIQARLLFAGRYYSGSGTQNVTSEIRQIKNNGDGYGGGAEMAFLTNDTERMRILSSGGITFNGDTAAANALDDYEEGTFTPDLGAGTYSYQHREGHYVKIGNMVHIHIGFKLSSASPTSSTASIGGLPFSGKSWGSYQEPHERVGAAGELITANLSSHLSFYVTNGGSTLYARTTANNADNPVAANAIWKTNSFIKLQLIYTVS